MGPLRMREMGSLLINVSIPITHVFFGISVSFLFSLFTLFFSFLLSTSVYCRCSPHSLFMIMAFYIAHHDRIYHLIAFGWLWVSFQDCPLACRLSSHYHYTVLAAPCLILIKKCFYFVFNLSLFSILLSG